MTALLEVRRLSVGFPIHGGLVEAVSGVSFTLERGRVVCLLGESGSGKSVTLRAIVRLNAGARTNGQILLDGRDVLALSRRQIRDSRRGSAAMVFQEPMTALDPSQRLERPPITGDPPNPVRPPSGCRFRTRCAFAMPRCAETPPSFAQIAPRHAVACHLFTAA